MTYYQDCHRHYGYLTRETAMARKLLERHGKPCVDAVKELRGETDMPMSECADMLRCLWRDMELERLQNENAKLRTFIGLKEACWKYVGWCGECPYNGVDDEHDDCNCTMQERINSLARELGIEVTA